MKTVIVLLATLLSTLELSSSAASQNRWRIDWIKPDRVYVMNKFDLVGSGFGDSQPRHTVVLMTRNDDGRPTIHKLRILKWSRKRIRLETPDLAVPGNYTVGIYVGTESNLISNEMNLTVLGGIVVHSITPNPAAPGDTIEIQGVHFGGSQVSRYVSINRFGTRTRLPILDWSDNLIRAQIPDGVGTGNYLLLIYYDETRAASSGGVDFTIERQRD